MFMATRSTGQIEEGPTGFSVACVDGLGVNRRFKPPQEALPSVLITTPVDRCLVTASHQITSGPFTVRAKVIGGVPIEAVALCVDDHGWVSIMPAPGGAGLWMAFVAHGGPRIAIRARGANGRTDHDIVEPDGSAWTPTLHIANGSDEDGIGALPEKFIFDTQLGPN